MGKDVKNNKGQALIEFILVMPVFIFLIMVIIDLGNIVYKKYNLTSNLDTIVDLYEAGDNQKLSAYASLEGVEVNISSTGEDLTKISISKSINIITPGLSNVIGKDYILSVDRTVYKVD